MKIILKKNNKIICENAKWARDFFARLCGLLGKAGFDVNDGLLISPCSQIHSLGMKFRFDVLYIDNTLRVVKVFENVAQNRILPYDSASKKVLELPLGKISACQITIGDFILLEE